jgi:putative OPT family oligopeptide transporter
MHKASGGVMEKEFKPFIAASKFIPELTIGPVLIGMLLGIVFGASSLYLALKVGMTVSASIPVAVLSITLFRGFSHMFGLRKATILENNITQTTGSAGESIAFGVAVTMPALLILGHEMELYRIIIVAVLGGLLGIFMMIPLRRALIVAGHGTLAYPEGTACAKVLIAGEEGGSSAKMVFGGFFFGLIYKFLNVGLKLWQEVWYKAIGFFKGAFVAVEVSPELLGVGYIIGPRIACITVAGGLVSSWVLTPMIKLFGDGLTVPLFPATKLISEMSTSEIWKNYVLYIGAGAVAAGGIISLFQSLPTIIRGAKEGMKGFKGAGASEKGLDRTQQDLPLPWIFGGSALLVIAIWLAPPLHLNLLGAVLVVMFGFLFVTVSSRLTGEIGSSSNPISGMTVATLLVVSLIFLALGWVGTEDRIAALSIAAVVCIAASNAGTTSQDLKTGFLVGGTPKYQQIGILIGALSSAIVIGFTLNLLNEASTIYSNKNIPAVTVPNVASLTEMQGVRDSAHPDDKNEYHVLRVAEVQTDGPLKGLISGKYLVANDGKIAYYVDPGINGVLKTRDNGFDVQKYDAPKARLMSLIIDGILAQKLPWGLVLLGVALAVVAELCGVAALPFAVGVYLPLSTSAPIFFGGLIRWFIQRRAHKGKVRKPTDEDETESGPGILYSSGLIAGGAIAGIAIAFLSMKEEWIDAMNVGKIYPALEHSMVLPVVVFGVMMLVLYRIALPTPAAKRK